MPEDLVKVVPIEKWRVPSLQYSLRRVLDVSSTDFQRMLKSLWYAYNLSLDILRSMGFRLDNHPFTYDFKEVEASVSLFEKLKVIGEFVCVLTLGLVLYVRLHVPTSYGNIAGISELLERFHIKLFQVRSSSLYSFLGSPIWVFSESGTQSGQILAHSTQILKY